MSSKSKKERKAEREARRAELRRQERQRTLATAVVVAIVLALGGLLVWVSLDDGDELADGLDDLDLPSETPAPATPQPPADPAEDARPIACDASLPEHAGDTKPVFDEPEQVISEGVAYEAVIETSCGRIVVELDAERAREGVGAFVFLATAGFYDGLEIFRHAPGIDVFQTGAGSNQASFRIGYTLPDELDAATEDGYPPGTLAYANAGPGTSGSQFFFVYGDAFDETVDAGGLQPIYTRFGMVTEGLDVLERMAEIPLDGETPEQRVYMETVRILADGEELPTERIEVAEPAGEPTADATPTGGPTSGATTPAPSPGVTVSASPAPSDDDR